MVYTPYVYIYEEASKHLEPRMKPAIWWRGYDGVGSDHRGKGVQVWFAIIMDFVSLFLDIH
jgi:hypothetical protein